MRVEQNLTRFQVEEYREFLREQREHGDILEAVDDTADLLRSGPGTPERNRVPYLPVPASTPSLSFPIPERLRAEAREVVALLREDPTPKAHVPRAVKLISELTDVGLHACYYVPVERMGVNLVARSSVRLGLKAAERSMFPVMRRIVEGLSEKQLRTLADFLEELVGAAEPCEEREAAEA